MQLLCKLRNLKLKLKAAKRSLLELKKRQSRSLEKKRISSRSQPQGSSVQSVDMILLSGGCCKQGEEMSLPHNFIDAPVAIILGVTMPSKVKV